MTGVSIVGAGLSAFGRQPGVSGREMAVQAIRSALADAGLEWPTCRSPSAAATAPGWPTRSSPSSGLTGIPFTNVKNGCATGGSALVSAVNAIRSGSADIALAVGFDKHGRGAFAPLPEEWGLRLVRRGRPDGDDAVLRHQDRALHARARHHAPDARAGRREGVPNGRLNPNAWRRTPMSAEEIASAEWSTTR